jgi:hypothetical protein
MGGRLRSFTQRGGLGGCNKDIKTTPATVKALVQYSPDLQFLDLHCMGNFQNYSGLAGFVSLSELHLSMNPFLTSAGWPPALPELRRLTLIVSCSSAQNWPSFASAAQHWPRLESFTLHDSTGAWSVGAEYDHWGISAAALFGAMAGWPNLSALTIRSVGRLSDVTPALVLEEATRMFPGEREGTRLQLAFSGAFAAGKIFGRPVAPAHAQQ